ncbi:MAG: hypothetical protein DRP81_08250 [Candidatus Omnitrophota bacterium]|nr:MAG: hypothetical protein DRP81_08250 [Candidatus Omnitrophota bacterium]
MTKFWQKKYKKNPNMVFRKIADEVILVPIRNKVGDLQSIYTLNEVGARIWELIDGKRELAKIKEILLEEFSVDVPRVEEDLKAFVQKLERIGAVEEVK